MKAPLEYFYTININNYDITPLLAGQKSFSLGESIYSLYPVAQLDVYLPSFLIEEGILSVGADVYITLQSSEELIKKTKTYKVWKIKVSTGDNKRSLSGIYSISMIHPWYFNQESKSQAYGGSVQMALYALYVESLFDYFNVFSVDKSLDKPSKFYRVFQTTGDFIESNLLKKFVVDNSPPFIYVNDDNEFHAHSFKTMLNNEKKNKLIDRTSIDVDDFELQKSEQLKRVLVPISIEYSLNESGNLWNRLNAYSTFLFNTGSSKTLSTLSGKSSYYGNKGFYPIHSSIGDNKKPLAIYWDDSQASTENVYASFLNKQSEILKDQIFLVNCYANFTVHVGEPIDLYLKKEDKTISLSSEKNSIFYASYLITAIRHIRVENSFVTQLILSRDIIEPKTANVLNDMKNAVTF